MQVPVGERGAVVRLELWLNLVDRMATDRLRLGLVGLPAAARRRNLFDNRGHGLLLLDARCLAGGSVGPFRAPRPVAAHGCIIARNDSGRLVFSDVVFARLLRRESAPG